MVPGAGLVLYLVGDTDAGVVPVGADVTQRTHDKGVSTVTHLSPANTTWRQTNILKPTKPDAGELHYCIT